MNTLVQSSVGTMMVNMETKARLLMIMRYIIEMEDANKIQKAKYTEVLVEGEVLGMQRESDVSIPEL